MDFQSLKPRSTIESTFCFVGCLRHNQFVQIHVKKKANLVGFVESSETTSLGKLALNAPRQLIVLGTCCVIISLTLPTPERERNTYPIKPNTLQTNFPHQLRRFDSVSLILRPRSGEVEELRQGVGRIHRHRRRGLSSHQPLIHHTTRREESTDNVSHDEVPTFFAEASFRNRS
jgi:hypothetical protein